MKIQLVADLKYKNKTNTQLNYMKRGYKIVLRCYENIESSPIFSFYNESKDIIFNMNYYLKCECSVRFKNKYTNTIIYNNMDNLIRINYQLGFLDCNEEIRFISKIIE